MSIVGQQQTFAVVANAKTLIAEIIEENVANLRMLFPIMLAMVATTAFAQVEMRLAYMTERPNTIPAVFPNNPLFRLAMYGVIVVVVFLTVVRVMQPHKPARVPVVPSRSSTFG